LAQTFFSQLVYTPNKHKRTRHKLEDPLGPIRYLMNHTCNTYYFLHVHLSTNIVRRYLCLRMHKIFHVNGLTWISSSQNSFDHDTHFYITLQVLISLGPSTKLHFPNPTPHLGVLEFLVAKIMDYMIYCVLILGQT
jgi:hypothetical protein